jgi:hypothetical protein
MVTPQNPFNFTARDFDDVYLDLKLRYPDKPDWFIILLAGLSDQYHWYLDARAQNNIISSAFTEEAIRDLSAMLDYYPPVVAASGGQFEVTVPAGPYPIIIPKAQLTWEVIPSTGGLVRFEATGDLTVSSGVAAPVVVVQGTTTGPVVLGSSDGTTEFQEFVLPTLNVDLTSIQITVNSIAYTRVETLVNSSPTDKVFRAIYKPNNTIVVQFGNGTFGEIPPAFPIEATYRVGGGILGNIKVRGTAVTNEAMGSGDGVSPNLQFLFDNNTLIKNTLVLTVAATPWTLVTDLSSSGPTDQHFILTRMSNGDLYAEFGDGINGEIPNGAVVASYTIGDSATITYVGGNANIITSFIQDDFSGGKDKESIVKARKLAPMMLRTNYRAVTETDYEVLSENFSASIVKAKCFPGYYGAGTVGVHLIPAGGGLPGTSIKAQLETYLRERSTLGSLDVRVRNPVYSAQDVSVGIRMRPGYSFATYQQYATLALRLLVSEVTTEIVQIFQETGIMDAVTYINQKWSYSFTSVDYPEITRILNRRIREEINLWGSDLNVNDIISILDDLTGVQSVNTPTLPVSNVSIAFDVVMTEGTITVTQVT